MKAMILAAGLGERLDPLTRNIPKPMMPILNKPVMAHIIELLKRHGIKEIMINLHHLGEVIKGYFGTGEALGVNIHYSHEEKLLGTAGGAKKVEDFFDDTFIVIGGDDLTDINLTRLVRYHKEKKALVTIALSIVDDPTEYGVVLINERGKITRFIEKPKGEVIFSNTVNTGVYVLEPRVLDFIPRGEFYDFAKNLFPMLLALKQPFYGHLTSNYWCDIGNILQYKQAHYDSINGRIILNIPFREVRKYVWLGEGVKIDPQATVGYPVVIGNNCEIRGGAQVLENSVLGNNCVIEEGATVKESILWDGAWVQANTWLERCIVGSDSHVKSNAAIFDGVVVNP